MFHTHPEANLSNSKPKDLYIMETNRQIQMTGIHRICYLFHCMDSAERRLESYP